MNTLQMLGAATAAAALTIGAAACSNNQTQSPKNSAPAESQTATATTTPMTTVVTGCLVAGEASGTYVLNAARSEGATTTSSYQLVGANPADLRDHVGEQVQISGTVTSGETVASRSMPQAETDKAKGTSGTPVVQTQTDVQIRRLQVSAVSPQGHKC